jgi:hypothetical protein
MRLCFTFLQQHSEISSKMDWQLPKVVVNKQRMNNFGAHGSKKDRQSEWHIPGTGPRLCPMADIFVAN